MSEHPTRLCRHVHVRHQCALARRVGVPQFQATARSRVLSAPAAPLSSAEPGASSLPLAAKGELGDSAVSPLSEYINLHLLLPFKNNFWGEQENQMTGGCVHTASRHGPTRRDFFGQGNTGPSNKQGFSCVGGAWGVWGQGGFSVAFLSSVLTVITGAEGQFAASSLRTVTGSKRFTGC